MGRRIRNIDQQRGCDGAERVKDARFGAHFTHMQFPRISRRLLDVLPYAEPKRAIIITMPGMLGARDGVFWSYNERPLSLNGPSAA
jgi:hypothetical protein